MIACYLHSAFLHHRATTTRPKSLEHSPIHDYAALNIQTGWQDFTWEFEAPGTLSGTSQVMPVEIRFQGDDGQGNMNMIGLDNVQLRRMR